MQKRKRKGLVVATRLQDDQQGPKVLVQADKESWA